MSPIGHPGGKLCSTLTPKGLEFKCCKDAIFGFYLIAINKTLHLLCFAYVIQFKYEFGWFVCTKKHI
ncbi:hypothetical protein HanRHA438_Chr06g0248921 [Helianthus annuus]|nr:hypothetical protein HanRHA438_Chr06g0248921 [Helianthus annuus]